MTYEDRFVCFIDVLGFTHLVTTTADADDAEVHEVANLLRIIRHVMDVDTTDGLLPSQVTQMFSDSVVFSFLATETSGLFHGLQYIQWLQQSLAWRGFFARGAFARGKLIHTKEILFGPAFLEAYDREQRAAHYPRVILDEDIIKAGIESRPRNHDKATEATFIKGLLERDTDGVWYVDYIAKGQSEFNNPEVDYPVYLATMRDTVRQGVQTTDLALRSKFEWLATKLSSVR
jgi:hypothetical protein